MPMTRYEIRNEYSLADPDLYRTADKDDPEALLEGVAMAGLVGVLRQLGDLAEFAADIFHNLHEEVMATATRGHGLMSRVQQLETEVPSIEKAFLSQTVHSSFFYHAGLDWHPNLQVDQNIITQGDLPRFIMDSYEECRAPPRLFLLDKFDVAGAGACLKRYTDPSFFKVETSGVTGLDVPREKKIRKGKKKGPRWRNGENPDVLPTSHTKLHQLFLEERVENGVSTPSHRAKLKRRLNGFPFAAKTEKSYMEKILNSTSPDHKLLHEVNANSSPLMLATNDSNKSGLEFRSVNPERESDGEKRSASSSPDGEEIMLKHTTCEQREIPILAGDGEKIISVDAESSREGSIIGYQSDCISSEVDNYVDAPSTIVSEMDTDRDFKVKSCFTSSNIKDQPLISEANEEDRHTRSSDAQSSTISDDGNNSSRKEISNFSSSDSPSTNQESENFSSKCSPLGDNPEVETIGGLSYKKTDDEDYPVDQHSKLDSRVEEKDMLNRPVWDEQVDEPKSDIRCHSRDSSVAMSMDLIEDRSDRDDRVPAENFTFEITNSTPEMISSGNLIPDKLDDESPMLPENLDELDCEDSIVSINDPDLFPCNMEDSLGTKPDNTSSVNAQTVHAEDNHSNSSMENQFINSPQEDGTFHSCEVEDLQGTCITDSEALESSCSAVECLEEPAGTSDTEISVPADLKSINEVRVVLDESESEADKSNTKVEHDENHLSESQQEEGQTKASTSENSFCNTVGHPESEVSDSLPNSHLDLEVESVHAANGLKTEDKIFQEMDSGNNDSEFEFVQVASGFETVEKIFQESDSGNHYSEVEFVQAVASGLEAGDRLLQENDSGNHDLEVEFAQASSGLETEDKIFRESDSGNHDSEVEFVQAARGLETEDKNVQESDSGNHDSEFEFIQASSGLEAEDKNFRKSDSGNHNSEVEFVQAASGLEAEVKIFLDSDSGNHVSDAPPSRHVDYDSEQSLVQENISLWPSQIDHDEGDSDSNSTFSFIHCESPHSINDPLNSIFPPTNQINLAELAPLPPLPPVQWRMGKSTPSNDEEVKSLLEETKQSPIQIAHGPTSKEEKVDNNETILETNFVPETIEPSPMIENKQPVSENEITATSEEDGVANGSQMMKLPRPRNPLVEDVAALDKSKLRKVTERIRPQIQKVDERDSLLEQIRTKSFNLRPAMASRPSIRGPNTNLNVAAILEKANAIRQAFVGSDEDDDDSWSDS